MQLDKDAKRLGEIETGTDNGPDPLATFSETIARLYEAQIDAARVPQARQALQHLLGAGEIAVVSGIAEHGERQLRTPPSHGAEPHVLWVDLGEEDTGPVRVQFRRHGAPFTPLQVQMLSLLRRHLRTAYRLGVITRRDAFGCLASTQLTQTMTKGVLIVDTDRRIHWRNPAAADILARKDGLSEEKGQLHTGRTFETANLQTHVCHAAEGRNGVMLVARPHEKHPYGLAFAAVKASASLYPGATTDHAFVLITIKQMQRQIKLITERLGELFGFTPAEVRLGALLLDGYSLHEAAQIAAKALPTVKTQLRSMLKKTGAHSQTELINLLLSLPSIL